MKIVIITRDQYLYGVQRIIASAAKKGHKVYIVNPTFYYLFVSNKNKVLPLNPLKNSDKSRPDVVFTRIGFADLEVVLSVVKQYEIVGVPVVNTSSATYKAKDKLSALQILAENNLPIVETLFINNTIHIDKVRRFIGEPPYIIKFLRGSQGNGVIYADNKKTLSSIMDAFLKINQRFIVQKYVNTRKQSDIRVFVVGDEVVGAMRRIPQVNEFRANVHKGAKLAKIKLKSDYNDLAIKAAKLLGLGVCGIDIMETEDGPAILELNASPGFEGLEAVIGKVVADKIVSYLEEVASSSSRRT